MSNQTQNSETINVSEILEALNQHSKKTLNFTEASTYLDISKSYLYKLTSGNKIPYFKPNGKKIYFSKAELDKWIMRYPVKSQEEIESEVAKHLLISTKGRIK